MVLRFYSLDGGKLSKVQKFGAHLISRPEGRDAALIIKNQILKDYQGDSIEIDFSEIKLMTPSWLDEIYQELLTKFPKNKIIFSNTANSSVKASLETVCE